MPMHGRVSARPPTRGFTMIELLVAMAIVGLVLTISLVAIGEVRERARRLQCQNQMRQVTLACLQFAEARGGLPFPEYPREILSTLEIPPVTDSAAPRLFPTLSCPSDPGTQVVHHNVSYRPCEGTNLNGPEENGVFLAQSRGRRKLSEITDGLSNTAMISERLAVGTDAKGMLPTIEPLAIRYPWTMEFQSDPALAAIACRTRRISQAGVFMNVASTIFETRLHGYTHRLQPNEAPCYNSLQSNVHLEKPLLPASSLHRAGVNVSLCDGSVRTVASNIDEQVWMELGTIAGNEP